MAGETENYSESEVHWAVRPLQEEGVGQNEVHRRLVFTGRRFSLERMFRCVITNFRMV
jgi:hypothetical protein